MALQKSTYDACKTKDTIKIDYSPARSTLTLRQALAAGVTSYLTPSVAYPARVRRVVGVFNDLLCGLRTIDAHGQQMARETNVVLQLCAANVLWNTCAATEKRVKKFLEALDLESAEDHAQETRQAIAYMNDRVVTTWADVLTHKAVAGSVRERTKPR